MASDPMTWSQHYDPLGNVILSTVVAALPAVVLLGSIAFLRIRIHFAALLGLATALGVALLSYRMPAIPALAATVYGAAYGLFPIGWIILNLIFLYQLTVKSGLFDVLRTSLATLAPDPRIQVILIAYCFGAFFEGAAGFGTPVAVTSVILMNLGFHPLRACGLSLIANTGPVAFGALGTPIIALAAVTGLDLHELSAMVGRQLPPFAALIPFWVVLAMSGWRGLAGVWPAALTAGLGFAVPQFLVSNYHGPWLVDIVAAASSMLALAALLCFWQPKEIWKLSEGGPVVTAVTRPERRVIWRAWIPWAVLSAVLFVWGTPQAKRCLNGELWSSPPAKGQAAVSTLTKWEWTVPGLHAVVRRTPPVVPPETKPEKAVYTLNWLSATGTGILIAGLIVAVTLRFRVRDVVQTYVATLVRVRFSLVTIAAMLALGYVTKYSGTDATLGLALARTGEWYPFFGTLLGWLGVALTGSDTASNVLFGSLQRITAEQTGISPVLMGAANSTGGVMGKMIDAQSIVVASTATNWYGHEGEILRYVFFHSLSLATLVGSWVYLQAKVAPFTNLVVP